jgi:long-chain acyl-CoA synthetase
VPLSGRIADHWRRTPDALALALGDDRLTYGDLARRAAAVAAGLAAMPRRHERGWMPPDGRLLALAVGNRGVFAELFAGATAGASACAVLDPAWPPAQAREVLRRLVPDLLVADGARTELLAAAGELGIPALTTGAGGSCTGWLARWAGADPGRELTAAGADGETFLVGFTSGTTGLPKAFRQPRRSWRTSLASGRQVWGLDAAAHTLAPGPLAHGLTLYALAECLDAGATFHGLPRFDANETASVLAEGEVRRLVLVPTMLSGLCAAAAGEPFPSVLLVVSGGARLEPELAEHARAVLPNARISEYYGASELGFVTVAGRPFPGVEVAVREEGTVFVRSPLVCDGYLWADDDRGLRRDGEWATVGDLGRLAPDGTLRVVGRQDGMVVTGGLNVYPAEVESVLRRIEGVEEAMVTGVADAHLGSLLVAVLSGPGAARLTHAALMAECRDHLPRYKVPRRVYATRRWPLTASGKVARRVVEEWIADGDERLVRLDAS